MCVIVWAAVVPTRLFLSVALVKMLLSLFTLLWSHGQGEGEVNHSFAAPLFVGLLLLKRNTYAHNCLAHFLAKKTLNPLPGLEECSRVTHSESFPSSESYNFKVIGNLVLYSELLVDS